MNRLAARRLVAFTAATFVLSLVVPTVSAEPTALLPIADVAPHRDASGEYLETVSVGVPDDTLPTFDARCHSARARAKARAVEALGRHVERVVERAGGTPPVIAEVRATLGTHAAIVERRPLVDCGIVLRVRAPLDTLASAAPGLEVAW